MATPTPSASCSYTSASKSTSYQNEYPTSTSYALGSRPGNESARSGTTRPGNGRRSRASRAPSTIGGGEFQQIICAISEARGVSPTVGVAFVNLSTGEAALSQICDNQFYARTINKLQVFEPTEILIASTSGPPNPKSKMYSVVEENVTGSKIVMVDRKYWSESSGLEYIQQLAFVEEVEAIKVAIGGNFYAKCCFAAVCCSLHLALIPLKFLTMFLPGSQIY